MDNNNIEQLKKLGQIFNVDKIVSPENIKEALSGVLSIMNTFKKDNIALTNETKSIVNGVLEKIQEERAKITEESKNLKSEIKDTSNSQQKELKAEFDNKIKELNSLITEVEMMKPEEIDQKQMVQDVLAQIKLPEQKDVILDNGEEIVNKINSLDATNDTLKIDATHIKNLPQFTREIIDRQGGFIETQLKAGTGTTVVKDAFGNWVISATGGGSSDTLKIGQWNPLLYGTVTDAVYRIITKCEFAGTINEISTICDSGTGTLTTKINTTAVTATANSVSSTRQDQAVSGANTFAVGDYITITVSSASALTNMGVTIKYTRS
jgi:hypothetical protein